MGVVGRAGLLLPIKGIRRKEGEEGKKGRGK
jgi:hypothetical protein